MLTITLLGKFMLLVVDQESVDSDVGSLDAECQIALVGQQRREQDRSPLELDMKLDVHSKDHTQCSSLNAQQRGRCLHGSVKQS